MKRKECKEFAAIFDSNKDQFGNGKTLIEFLEDVSSLFYFFCNYYIIFIIYNLLLFIFFVYFCSLLVKNHILLLV